MCFFYDDNIFQTALARTRTRALRANAAFIPIEISNAHALVAQIRGPRALERIRGGLAVLAVRGDHLGAVVHHARGVRGGSARHVRDAVRGARRRLPRVAFRVRSARRLAWRVREGVSGARGARHAHVG